MKKIILITIFILIPIFNSYSKTLDVGIHKLEVPNYFYLKDISNIDILNKFASDACLDFSKCYTIIPRKMNEILDKIDGGKDYNDIKILKPIVSKINKLSNSSYNTAGRKLKSLLATIRSTLKKNNSNFFFNYYFSDKSINEVLELENYDVSIEEVRTMSNNELKNLDKDIKKEILKGSNTFAVTDEASIKFKKFNISKTLNGTPYLLIEGAVYYFYKQNHKLGDFLYYVSEDNGKIFILDGYCLVDCSWFDDTFNQIVHKSFNRISLTKEASQSNDTNLVEQLKSLNDLYKSGVLTKEEFERTKKKLLN